MASEVEICNRALQKLGAKRIVSLTQDSVSARACNVAYEIIRDKLYRSHFWSFTIRRAVLAADSSAPTWGKANAFQVPSDFIKLAPPYQEDNTNYKDWVIEGKKIYTNDDAPLYIRYVAQVTDPNDMDALFRELLACDIALELCQELTESNTKKADLKLDRKDILADAKKANAFEKISAFPPDDTYLSCRA